MEIQWRVIVGDILRVIPIWIGLACLLAIALSIIGGAGIGTYYLLALFWPLWLAEGIGAVISVSLTVSLVLIVSGKALIW